MPSASPSSTVLSFNWLSFRGETGVKVDWNCLLMMFALSTFTVWYVLIRGSLTGQMSWASRLEFFRKEKSFLTENLDWHVSGVEETFWSKYMFQIAVCACLISDLTTCLRFKKCFLSLGLSERLCLWFRESLSQISLLISWVIQRRLLFEPDFLQGMNLGRPSFTKVLIWTRTNVVQLSGRSTLQENLVWPDPCRS